MTWTAPAVDRSEPGVAESERAALEQWLDFHRATLLHKCAGLTPEQLAQRPVGSSTLSLLGLVRHMVEVERWWFRINVAGEDVAAPYSRPDSPDADFDEAAPETAEVAFAAFSNEVELSRVAVSGRRLEESFVSKGRHARPLDVRWVYVHMIEEYARHNGHADLLRELVDGTTGE